MAERIKDFVQFFPDQAPPVAPWEELPDGSHKNLFIIPWIEKRSSSNKPNDEGGSAIDLFTPYEQVVRSKDLSISSPGEIDVVGGNIGDHVESL